MKKRCPALALSLCAMSLFAMLISGCGGHPDTSDSEKYDLADYIDAPHISDVTVSLAEIDEAYDDLLTEIRLFYAEYTETDSPESVAEEFDRVGFSYTGVPADIEVGEELLSALAGESSAVIGSQTLYPAYENLQNPELSTESFEDQLIGARPGQTLEIFVTYPENASASGVDVSPLRGTRIRFTLTVTSLEKAELPEPSDSLISRYTGGDFQTLEAFRLDAYRTIKSQYAFLALYDSVHVISRPQEWVDTETVLYIQNVILSEYDPSALTDEMIEKITDELHERAVEYANAAVADRMIRDYLCDLAGITLSDAEYAAALSEDFAENFIAYSYVGIDSESELERRYGIDNLRTEYRVDKLMNKVCDLVRFI